MCTLNIGLVQINPVLGDFEQNLNKVLEVWTQVDGHSHIVILPELALCGFFPADLFFETDFLLNLNKTIKKLIEASENFNSTLIIGTPYFDRGLFNSALVIKKGAVLAGYYKRCLNETLNERKYFYQGFKPLIINFKKFKIGISIGWDCWKDNGWFHFYEDMDIDLLINLGAFPYYVGSFQERQKVFKALAQRFNSYIVCSNLVGGQECWVFDGRSFVIDPYEETAVLLSGFKEDFCIFSIDYESILRKKLSNTQAKKEIEPCKFCVFDEIFLEDKRTPLRFDGKKEPSLAEEEKVYKALVLSLRDYVEKNKFKKVVLGLSGGMDSSLVACIAVDALGKERVIGVFMPSPFTSKESKEDAEALAQNLGIEFLEYPIGEVFETFRKTLGYSDFDVADENLQARIRANILFYLSNKKGYLVLCTSNKSEASVGYGTIYGDMAGGFAPIIDVYKTMVYRLAKYRNHLKPDIPERVFLKVPSAELRPGQTDYEVLPPYEILDQILYLYLEKKYSCQAIIEKGFEKSVVEKVLAMVKRAEFKRKQAPFGPKVTKISLVADRNYPVV